MYIKSLSFSLWADFIERDFISTGLKELIDKGVVNGATSNPAIFKNAILTSAAYKTQLETLSHLDAKSKYEQLAITDIQAAADVLKPLYNKGDDGFVSIEVDPFLSDDAEATINEGKRLFKSIDRENVMIKVPATTAGYIAMKELTQSGIHVNATLIFSLEQATSCAEAFKSAKEGVKSVISVFVSRIDRAIDERLQTKGVETFLTGIYNAARIYSAVEALHVKNCRTLFASTGVKGDGKVAQYYINELLASNSVNTAPIETIDAYVKGKDTQAKLPINSDIIDEHMLKVKNAGIDLDKEIDKQIKDGLEAFKVAFKEILDALE